MNPAHVHLVLNHFSIIGSVFCLALLTAAMVRKSRELTVVSFAFIAAIAAVSIAVYFTGAPAGRQIEHLPGVTEEAIRHHSEAADFGFAGIECLGALALAGLALFRTEPVPRWFLALMLTGALLTAGAMFYTADRGRYIRHSEIGARIERESYIPGFPAAFFGMLSDRQASPA